MHVAGGDRIQAPAGLTRNEIRRPDIQWGTLVLKKFLLEKKKDENRESKKHHSF